MMAVRGRRDSVTLSLWGIKIKEIRGPKLKGINALVDERNQEVETTMGR